MTGTDREAGRSACWIPTIPETGEYGVYVSYQTLANSTTAAQYEVRHKGGSTRFSVNQRMGGGTWIYLGRFTFKKGRHSDQGVFLTNMGDGNTVVTSDASQAASSRSAAAKAQTVVRKNVSIRLILKL